MRLLTLLALILGVLLLLILALRAESPAWLGETAHNPPKRASLIAPSLFLSVDHYHPRPGDTVRFPGGETRLVVSGERVPEFSGLFDLWIGRLDEPSGIEPVKCWWNGLPPNGTTLDVVVGGELTTTGTLENWFRFAGPVGPGDSGLPVVHRGGLLGLVSLSYSNGDGLAWPLATIWPEITPPASFPAPPRASVAFAFGSGVLVTARGPGRPSWATRASLAEGWRPLSAPDWQPVSDPWESAVLQDLAQRAFFRIEYDN